jgi:hypothetical protein
MSSDPKYLDIAATHPTYKALSFRDSAKELFYFDKDGKFHGEAEDVVRAFINAFERIDKLRAALGVLKDGIGVSHRAREFIDATLLLDVYAMKI